MKQEWNVADKLSMIPLICAECREKMCANSDQVVYQCGNCHSSFMLIDGSLKRITLQHYAGSGETRLPFWQADFAVKSSKGAISHLQTLLSWCGSIKQVEYGQSKPQIFIPAGAMSPPSRIRLGKNILLRSPRFKQLSSEKLYSFEPTVMDASDIEALGEMIILSAIVEARRSDGDFLHSFSLELGACKLVTIPFTIIGSRLIQKELELEIS